jgi:hypothetical protein
MPSLSLSATTRPSPSKRGWACAATTARYRYPHRAIETSVRIQGCWPGLFMVEPTSCGRQRWRLSSCARAHGKCSVGDRHERAVGFIGSSMPADGIPRCPSAWNGDIGTSRLEEQPQRRLYDPGLIQKTSCWPRHGTNNSAKITDPNVRSGSGPCKKAFSHNQGHGPKVSLGANLVRTTSDNRHQFQPRRFLSRACAEARKSGLAVGQVQCSEDQYC